MKDLPKIDNSNLWDKTYSILKELIITRKFSPNQKLYIPELAQQLGVSRTPIRDALNRLEMDGLVTTVSKVGTFVNPIEASDVINIMDTRLMLEFWVVDQLSTCSKDERLEKIQQMDNVLQQSLINLELMSLQEYLQRDYNLVFHLEFIKLGNNKKNIAIYKKLMDYRFLTIKNDMVTKDILLSALTQHQAIVDVLRDGSEKEMKAVIKKHLDDSERLLIQKVKENGGVI